MAMMTMPPKEWAGHVAQNVSGQLKSNHKGEYTPIAIKWNKNFLNC